MRVAVVGLGFMGSMHLKALRGIPGAELVAVCSGDERKLAGDLSSIKGNLGGPGERFDFAGVRKYREIKELLADSGVDAVSLCVPTDLHAPMTLQALQAGKHVLVEKPMALDGESARGMIGAAKRAGKVLMVGQVLRFFPMYEVLRGVEGVSWAMFRRRCASPGWGGWLADARRSGGGVFDLLIHDVDMCLHLFGLPAAVRATGAVDLAAGIDVMTGELRYCWGTAWISGGWHSAKYPFSMEYTVLSKQGTFEYSSLYSSTSESPILYTSDGGRENLAGSERDGYRAEMEYFVECCRAGVDPELCRPEESAAAVDMMNLLLESRSRDGEVLEASWISA